MAAITAKMVSELRAKTNAGMMECKKALSEANGDFDEAAKILRERGLAGAAKKAGRIAAVSDSVYGMKNGRLFLSDRQTVGTQLL